MEMKYDGYYKKEIPYKMTLEELFERSTIKEDYFYMCHEDILAYIRERGENFTCMAHATVPENMMHLPFGMGCISSGEKELVPCRIVLSDDELYNPLHEGNDTFHKNHWHHPYKIKFTPIEFKGCIERMYVSDFCGHIQKGYIILTELDIPDSARFPEESA